MQVHRPFEFEAIDFEVGAGVTHLATNRPEATIYPAQAEHVYPVDEMVANTLTAVPLCDRGSEPRADRIAIRWPGAREQAVRLLRGEQRHARRGQGLSREA